jgi:hypothetical protein
MFDDGYEITILIKDRDTGECTLVNRKTEHRTWTPLLHAFAEALNGSGFVDVKSRIGILDGLPTEFNGELSWTVLKDCGYYE